MVYNKISLYTSKVPNEDIGEFYGFFFGITTKCSSVNHRKITLEYEKWCIQNKLLIINAFELTKYRRWFPILVCLFILLRIENIYTTYHVIKLLDHREFDKVNIDALIEKWMLCDALWVHVGKKRGNIV
jgi:hypothetical protein